MTTATATTNDQVIGYISENWGRCRRNKEAGEAFGVFALPKPYLVPCVSDDLQAFYYWDTYFTNVGLLLSGRRDWAADNVENLLFEAQTFGYVPGSNTFWGLSSSQPPLTALAVGDLFDAAPDVKFAERALPALRVEMKFWDTRVVDPSGLCRYGTTLPGSDFRDFYAWARTRLKWKTEHTDAEKQRIVESLRAEGESGWDFTPRFGGACVKHAPVDLNCILYKARGVMAQLCDQVGAREEAEQWRARAREIAGAVCVLCWSAKQQLFADWNFERNTHPEIPSLATFFPLWADIATAQQAAAVANNLPLFEARYGLLTCAPGPRVGEYQWDAPNVWAPLQYIAISGLLKYGFRDDALRLARKFLEGMNLSFRETGQLWEKYNGNDPLKDTSSEYATPPMMGWTAATYLWLDELLRSDGAGL